ncbi:MAG: dihydrofolate reductase family protein [bacterium]
MVFAVATAVGNLWIGVGVWRQTKYALRYYDGMRRIRYAVAMSLDGYIAGPNDEVDWILMDPEIDFFGLFAQFDTFLLGRRTFEALGRMNTGISLTKTYVFSRTLQQSDHPDVTFVSDEVEETVAALRAEESNKDIWVYGGGVLFRSLLDAGLVDTVEVAVIPVLLGEGKPLLPPPAKQANLKLTGHKVYKTGIVSLEYSVMSEAH